MHNYENEFWVLLQEETGGTSEDGKNSALTYKRAYSTIYMQNETTGKNQKSTVSECIDPQ